MYLKYFLDQIESSFNSTRASPIIMQMVLEYMHLIIQLQTHLAIHSNAYG